MIIVTKLPSGKLGLKSHYFYKDRIKKIPTATFDGETKTWTIESFALGSLENEFNGELVYKTPRWVILNQEMPDMSSMYKINDTSIKIPDLKVKLYDYQEYGVKFMIDKILDKNFVIMCDDVGLGKTGQSIATIKWFIENRGFKKILLLSKKSAKSQWHSEFDKFTDLSDTFNIEYTKSTASHRKKAYKNFCNSDKAILITNYHSFLNDTDLFKSMKIDMVCIDEVHEIKARNGKMNNNISKIVKDKPTIFLTGTPIMSKPEDIFGIIQIANKDYFGKWSDFEKKYITKIQTNFGYQNIGAKNLDELREKVQDVLIRRTEFEVSLSLPKIIMSDIKCPMDDTQIKLIQSMNELQDNLNEKISNIRKKIAIEEKNGDNSLVNKLYIELNRLDAQSKAFIAGKQAAATDPRMFLHSNSNMFKKIGEQCIPKTYKLSSKSEAIIELIEDILQSQEKVILFSKFKTSAILISDDIKSKLKVNTLLYTGDESDDVRSNNIKLFWNNNDYNIIIGTEAMSASLNLQCAQYVINIDQPDTAAIKTQRIGRSRRIGASFSNTRVYDMITIDPNGFIKSKDEERLENIQKNIDLTDALVSINEAQRKALIKEMKG